MKDPVPSKSRLLRCIAAMVLISGCGAVVADSRAGGDVGAQWAEFPPEDYNPYLPQSQRPVQQLVSPLANPAARVPVSPVLPARPLVTPVLPGPGLYRPQVVPYPGGVPWVAPLYAPDPGLYPGYFNPFNPNQFVSPFF